MPKTIYNVSTTDADVEAGYPEFSKSCFSIKETLETITNAKTEGIPSYRLTVCEWYGNGGHNDKFIDSMNADDFKSEHNLFQSGL